MKHKQLSAAILLAVCGYSAPSMSMTLEERLAQMEQRMQYMEKRMVAQDRALVAKDQQINALKKASGSSGGWFQKVEVSGLVEVEGSHSSPFIGSNTSDLVLATAEIGLNAQVHDWVSAEIVMLYEEDDTPLEVDTAVINIANPDANWLVSAGQQYLPFGTYETGLVSDPLTLEIGETRETAVLVGTQMDNISASAYVFNGDTNKSDDDTIDNWGATLGFANDQFTLGVGYINDISDSDTLQDAVGSTELKQRVPGVTVDASAKLGNFTLIGEYTATTRSFQTAELEFDGSGAQPKAFNIEAGTEFSLFGKDASAAVAYQGTKEALALELPEKRIAAAISVAIFDNTALAFEWAHDKDYSTSEGGTGKSADTLTTQLAVEF